MTHTMTNEPIYALDVHEETPVKRLLAWVIDVILIAVATAIVVVLTAFIGAFFAPLIFGVLSFFYRWATLAGGSATLGMRVMAVSIRNPDGSALDGGQAFLHTLGYFVSVAVFPLQLVSIVLMLTSSRKQGLTDHILGTLPINNTARF